MLETTNPYSGPVEDFHYAVINTRYNLRKMVLERLCSRSSNRPAKERCFESIKWALVDYVEHYPAPYSLNKECRRFNAWLQAMITRYGLEGSVIPEELSDGLNEEDAVVSLVKVLQNREGVNK